MSHRGRTSADECLAAALAAGRTALQAAELAGVSRKTVERRRRDPAFQQRVAVLRAELLDAATGALADRLSRAVETLAAALDDADARVRVRAADVLLTQMLAYRQHGELAARVAALEASG
ncbi:MAG: hypothetical protein ACRC33_31900, partial [Gemmataceae bacterium]